MREIQLDDCGKIVEDEFGVEQRILMVIDAPRGRLALFDPQYNPQPKDGRRSENLYSKLGKAVRYFMEAHKHD